MIKKSFTIIIPAYNEEEAIEATLLSLVNTYALVADIIVVNDGSTDRTQEIVKTVPNVRRIDHKQNHGYGASLKTGILNAQTDIICFCDADGQHNSSDIDKLIRSMGEADMVVGSRGINAFKNWYRAPGKFILHVIANFLVRKNIPDLNSGLRVIKRDIILRYLHLLPDGFSASTTTTMILLSRDYDVKYVPISINRRRGKSQVKQVSDGINTIKLILRLIMLFNPLRFFVTFGFAFINIGLFYGIYKVFTNNRLGFPVGALLISLAGILSFMFGLLAEQISELRLERFERVDYSKYVQDSQKID